jgi:hypothetical protein
MVRISCSPPWVHGSLCVSICTRVRACLCVCVYQYIGRCPVMLLSIQNKAVPPHAMKALGGKSSLTLLFIPGRGTRWGGGVVSGQRHAQAPFYPGGRTPGTHWVGGWVDPKAGLDIEARGKILLILLGIEHRSPDRPVRSHDTILTELPRLLLTNLSGRIISFNNDLRVFRTRFLIPISEPTFLYIFHRYLSFFSPLSVPSKSRASQWVH